MKQVIYTNQNKEAELMNMAAKYMFIGTYSNEDMRRLFDNCHCPVDSVMLSAVKTRCSDASWKADYSWSIMVGDKNNIPTVYTEFQNLVKKLVGDTYLPIDIDYLYWD